MFKLSYKKDGKLITSPIMYVYEFNTEYIQTKNEDQKDLICFIVQEDGEEQWIEYYLNRNTDPDDIWWHNRFLKGTSFEKKLASTSKGDTFNYRKKAYEYRVLTDAEVSILVKKTYVHTI